MRIDMRMDVHMNMCMDVCRHAVCGRADEHVCGHVRACCVDRYADMSTDAIPLIPKKYPRYNLNMNVKIKIF